MGTSRHPNVTHRLVHRDGRDIKVNLPPRIREGLKSDDPDARAEAQAFICLKFRHATVSKYRGRRPDTEVQWEDLTLHELGPSFRTRERTAKVHRVGAIAGIQQVRAASTK